MVNGRNVWRSQNGFHAIWFTKAMNYWSIGSYEDHQGTNNGGIWTATNSSCPNQEDLFLYHNGHATSGAEYYEAPINTVSIKCL